MKNKKILFILLVVVAIVAGVIYYLNFRYVKVEFAAKIGAGVAPVSVRVGEVISEPDAPESDEYKFLGWYLGDEKFDFSKPITKSVKLEAKWKKIDE